MRDPQARRCLMSVYAPYVLVDPEDGTSTLSSESTDATECSTLILRQADPLYGARTALGRGEDPQPYLSASLSPVWKSMGLAMVSEFHALRGDVQGAVWYARRALDQARTVHAVLAHARVMAELGMVRSAYIQIRKAMDAYGPLRALTEESMRLSPVASGDSFLIRRLWGSRIITTQNHWKNSHHSGLGGQVSLADPAGLGHVRHSGQVVLLDRRFLRVYGTGLGILVHQHVVQGSSGGRKVYSLVYSPAHRAFRLLRSTLVRRGRRFSGVARITYKELLPLDTRMYFQVKRVEISFPDTEPGDVLEVVYELRDIPGTSLLGKYFGALMDLQDDLPVLKSEVYVRGEGLSVHAPPGASVSRSSTEVRISIASLPSRIHEPLARPRADYAVEVSGFSSWQDVAVTYWKTLKPYYEDNPFLKERFGGTRREILDGVAKRLQNMRYVSLMFGRHGYYPYSAREILHRRFGDCKDMTLVGVLMLRAAGIRAEPVVVRTRVSPDVPEGVPSLAYFDHTLIYLPDDRTFMDGAAKGIPYPLVPAWDQGARMLRITRPSPSPRTIPASPPSENRVISDIRVTGRPGRWKVRLSMRLYGLSAVSWLESSGPSHLKKWFDPAASVVRYKTGTISDGISVSAVLTSTSRSLPLSLGWQDTWESWTRLSSRRLPVSIPYAVSFSARIRLPASRSGRYRDMSVSGGPFVFEQTYSGGIITRSWTMRDITVPVGVYASVRKAVLRAMEVVNDPLE